MIEGLQSSQSFSLVRPVQVIQERYVSTPDVGAEKSERAYKQGDQVEISAEAWAQYAAVSASGQSANAVKEGKEEQNPQKNPDSQATPTTDQSHAVRQTHKSGKSSDKKGEGDSKEGTKKELTEDDKKEITRLKKRDSEVRAHEQAHLAAAGGLAAGGASYEFEKGPDGVQYAVGGEVPISSGGGDTPEERLQNAERVYRAALAPANPSSQDRSIASQASSDATQARAEIAEEQAAKVSGDESTSQADPTDEAKPESKIGSTTEAKPDDDSKSTTDSASATPKAAWQKAIDAYKASSKETPVTSAPKSEWQKAMDAYKATENGNAAPTLYPTSPTITRQVNISA